MTTQHTDPIGSSLDELADSVVHLHAGDRMPDIRRRVRTARRRRSAAAGAAAALVAVAGVGLWQGLDGGPQEVAPADPGPTDPAPTPTDPRTTTTAVEPHQEVALTVDTGDGTLLVSYRISGTSTEYVDGTTGDPTGYAGPRYTQVYVDGEPASGSDGGDIACRAGQPVSDYDEVFGRKPVVLPVDPGRHVVTVEAPFCADGEVVDSTDRRVVYVLSGEPTVGDTRTADLDGDGVEETIEVVYPAETAAPDAEQVVRVAWGTGETTEAGYADAAESRVLVPLDLDGDGDLEVVVESSGGEYVEGRVFDATPAGLTAVPTVDADGRDLVLGSGDPDGWQLLVDASGISSYRLLDAGSSVTPAPVEVRRWDLVDGVLVRSATTTQACAAFGEGPVQLGPC